MAILSTDSIPLQQALRRRATPKAVGGSATARAHGWSTDGSGAGGGPLGNNAILSALFLEAVDSETGEIHRLERKPDGSLGVAPPSRLQQQALMYSRKAGLDSLLQLLPPRKNGQPHRCFKCHRYPLPNGQVAAMYSEQYKKAFYAGVQVCANQWLCPVCMRKLSERKKGEVEEGLLRAKAKGWRAVLITLNFRHTKDDKLAVLLSQLVGKDSASDKFGKNKAGRLLKQQLGYQGHIRALEITHGENGWHPHLHTLMFIEDHSISVEEIQERASAIWSKACSKVGAFAHLVHGCNVQEGNDAGSYISKMGLDKGITSLASEVAKGSSKLGRRSGRSYLQILDGAISGSAQDTALWVEFAMATEGRDALRWSNKLREKLAMGQELTDEEIAAETEDESALIFSLITGAGWKRIYGEGFEAHLLNLIETNPDRAREFIAWIQTEKD